jgi:hypothetical protein
MHGDLRYVALQTIEDMSLKMWCDCGAEVSEP